MNLNDPEVDDLPLDDADEIETGDIQEEQQQEEEAEDEIGFGDEEEDDSAPDLPKRLRNEIKARDRELALTKKRLAELEKPAATIDVGERPTREQFDWDDDAYDKAIDDWNERRLRAQQQAEQPNDIQADAMKDVQRFTSAIATLPYADAEDVVASAMEALTPDQQYVFARAAKDGDKLVYALGKNPGRLKALLDIKDPVKFIAEVARMETQMTTRKPVAPEQVRSGDARPAVSGDKETARLQKQAEASGDYSALLAHKRRLREKAA